MKLIHIVHQLRQAQGSNAKLDTLRIYSDNELWKKFLIYTYDERKTYGVSAPKTFDFDAEEITEEMFRSFDNLATRRITGNEARTLAKRLSTVFGEIPRLILGRSMKAGVSTGLINRSYNDLIPLFKTMKGKDIPIEIYPVLSSIKYDGVKIFGHVKSGVTPILMTSSGAEVRLKSLEKELSRCEYGMYEGELVHKDGKQIHRPVITGQLVSLMSGTKDDIGDYTYIPYDRISLEEWEEKESSTSYLDRFGCMLEGFETTLQDSAYIKPIYQKFLHSKEEVEEMFSDLILRGFEGTMHRYAEDYYMWTGERRTDRLIKKKSNRQAVLMCVGTIPHSNPAKGITGSLMCKGIVNDKVAGRVEVEVNVGSGLSKMDIMFSEERYIGKEIEILYNSVTESDGKHSLFLARYKRIKGEI